MRAVSGLRVLTLLSLTLGPAALAQSAGQTDWSGGGGIPGPVTGWQRQFATSVGVDWTSQNGPLTLLSALPTPHQVTTTVGQPTGAAAGDLDGDGDLDIAAVAYQGNEVAWWENDGSGGGWARHTIADWFTGALSLHLCDINGDEDPDVAATAEGAGVVVWWENNLPDADWIAHVVDTISPNSVCDADFDGDGDLDLCGAAFNADTVAWWENTDGSGGAWLTHPIDTGFSGAWWADAGDLDADGDADVAGVALVTGEVCWWENNGNGTGWTSHNVDGGFSLPVCVRLADMDGDADLDVLAASNGGQLAWWERNGSTGLWTKHLVAGGLSGPLSVRAADLDEDGDLDVIGNERNIDRVMWYENVDGQGRVWCVRLVDGTSDGPNDVLAADIDGNGSEDVIATFSFSNSIVWYQQTGTPATSGVLQSSILDCGGPVHDWGNIVWACDTPAGTSVRVEVRAANSPGNMGPFSQVLSSGEDLSSYLANLTRYFQYRVLLASAGNASPSFENLHLDWDDVTGVEEGGTTADALPFYCKIARNPSFSGAVAFDFALPRACIAGLSIFDPAGRQVRTVPATAYPAGRHSALIRGLPGGIYFYVLQADELRSSGKVVVR